MCKYCEGESINVKSNDKRALDSWAILDGSNMFVEYNTKDDGCATIEVPINFCPFCGRCLK